MNYRFFPRCLTGIFILLLGVGSRAKVLAANSPVPQGEIVIQAVGEKEKEWKPRKTFALDSWPGAATLPPDTGQDQFGGLVARHHKASGFFRVEKTGDRWMLIDPEGNEFYDTAVAAVRLEKGPAAQEAMKSRFGTPEGWASATSELLKSNAFRGTGAWSDDKLLAKAPARLVYTKTWSFMSEFGRRAVGARMGSGHMAFPNSCVPVFHPGFEAFCEEYAKKLLETKDDPWLLGNFSDNELTFVDGSLSRYLQLPEGDPGREAASSWLKNRYGPEALPEQVTKADEAAFLSVVLDRYYRIVSAAMRRNDPNHLYLGSRFYGKDRPVAEVFRAIAPYADVVSVNWYNGWTPGEDDQVSMWSRESGRPFLITEFYAKAEDSGLGNKSGAGFLVHTQKDRGLFYQNFTLGLLRSKNCVGWHWFRYADNDPSSGKEDPSNIDANKGIVSSTYVPYTVLLSMMKSVNERVFSLIDYFDGKLPSPGASASPAP
jgi:hypothetical protein